LPLPSNATNSMGVSTPNYKSWAFAPPPDWLRSPMSDRLALPPPEIQLSQSSPQQ
jgi:hypothetical protein